MAAIYSDVRQPPPLNPSWKQPITAKPAASPEPTPPSDEETAAKALQRSVMESTIAQYIREAMQARENSGIEEEWQEAEDLYNGVDELSGPTALVKTRDQAPRRDAPSTARSRVVLNITKPKTQHGVSRVQEMLVPNDDKPWAIEATPIPEFDLAAADAPGAQQVRIADGSLQDASTVARFLKDKGDEFAKNMTTWVEDHFVEGRVYPELRKVIRDAGRMGTGVLKGPFPVGRVERKWTRDETNTVRLQKVTKTKPTACRKRAQDCFPDPSCGDDIHKGSFFVEREYFTRRQLTRLQYDPSYDRNGIARALEEGPQRGVKDRNDRTARLTPGETTNDAKHFELFYVYCDVEPDSLMAMGMLDELDETERQLAVIPAIVTMLNGRAIKCDVNPNETGEFPFDFFPWDEVEGQVWGRGIPYAMKVAQKGCTASVRALLENAGLSSGPIIAFMEGLQPVPTGSAWEIKARAMFRFTPDAKGLVDDIRKVIQTFNIDSHIDELLKLIQFFLNMADQLTNLPMLLQGEQQAGTSPETLGGMRLLVQNAASPLRTRAKSYDDSLITPQLTRWHDWGMQHGPDNIKGDLQVRARGSTVLVQREEAREFLVSLFGVKDDPSLRINPAKYATEMARAHGFDMASIQYNDVEWKQHVEQMQAQGMPEDPKVTAAKLKLADNDKQRQFEAQDNDAERQLKGMLKQLDVMLEQRRLQGEEAMSLDDVKAALMKIAMQERTKVQKIAADAATPHQGV